MSSGPQWINIYNLLAGRRFVFKRTVVDRLNEINMNRYRRASYIAYMVTTTSFTVIVCQLNLKAHGKFRLSFPLVISIHASVSLGIILVVKCVGWCPLWLNTRALGSAWQSNLNGFAWTRVLRLIIPSCWPKKAWIFTPLLLLVIYPAHQTTWQWWLTNWHTADSTKEEITCVHEFIQEVLASQLVKLYVGLRPRVTPGSP